MPTFLSNLSAEEQRLLDELEGWTRSHRTLQAGLGNADDVQGFIDWYRSLRENERSTFTGGDE